jgi:oxygen-independent coproporphyrinogen III oxidase
MQRPARHAGADGGAVGAEDAAGSCGTPTGRPIGWYVHLPFCTTKCGYCDFYSLPTIPGLIDDLVGALVRELEGRNPGRPVETIFVGGGTPTVLPEPALARILSEITGRAGRVAEFTVEANPSSTDELKLGVLKRCGVTRVSFGAQSFDPEELKVLERLHDPKHIFESVAAARAAGFDNINLDLIYAIPGQTVASWKATLSRAIELGTEHLSCYSLMYEPGTSLTRLRNEGRMIPSDEDLEAEMFECTIEMLTAAGFEHYEVSNFARAGRRCRANVIYWENREYLGVGPSAVSYLDGVRQKNVADVRRYVEMMHADPSAVVVEREALTPLGRACETAVQMLRLTEGIDRARFREQTGFDVGELYAERIKEFATLGLLHSDERGIRLTGRGMLVANRVMAEFLPEPAST